MNQRRDRMRLFAWALVVLGIGVIAASPLYAARESERLYQTWLDHTPRAGESLAEIDASIRWLSEKIRMIDRRERPAWTVASPWPVAGGGVAVAGFGVLLLAIRRPASRSGPGAPTSASA